MIVARIPLTAIYYALFVLVLRVWVTVFSAGYELSDTTIQCTIVYGYRVLTHPLRKYPGPLIARMTDWYGAFYALQKSLHIVTYEDHQRYGL